MNRRTLLKISAAAMSGITLPRVVAPTNVLATQETSPFPELVITMTDDGFVFPEGTTSGRYVVKVVNESSAPSHSPLGRLPEGIDLAAVEEAFAEEESDDVPQWMLDTEWVGLPDWGLPAETRSGIVDFPPGTYLGFGALAPWFNIIEIGGDPIDAPPVPDATLSVELIEMAFSWGQDAVPSGPQLLRVANVGATLHDIQFYPVPEGTTTDHVIDLFMLEEGDSLASDNPLAGMSADDLVPAAAISIISPGVTSWIDINLAPGNYFVMCPLPFPSGPPHAFLGMMEIITVE
ncbi:MAG: hypothetical protein KF883_11300 [Thermomicrobiales bacterium]|nr:hypothetical protein [Thermomicrobiales bacterium]